MFLGRVVPELDWPDATHQTGVEDFRSLWASQWRTAKDEIVAGWMTQSFPWKAFALAKTKKKKKKRKKKEKTKNPQKQKGQPTTHKPTRSQKKPSHHQNKTKPHTTPSTRASSSKNDPDSSGIKGLEGEVKGMGSGAVDQKEITYRNIKFNEKKGTVEIGL